MNSGAMFAVALSFFLTIDFEFDNGARELLLLFGG